jgi:hypothetical protein
MDIFDKSKEVVGNHVGNATDEAMRVVVSKLLGAVNAVSSPSQSAQSGRMSRAYQSGVKDGNSGLQMRVPAFCYDKKTEVITSPDGNSVAKIVELENDDLISEYQRGYNNAVNANWWKKVLIFGGVGVVSVTGIIFYCSYRADSRRRELKQKND